MNTERWEQVARLYEAAVERPERERAAFIADSTANDEGLRREVESLLAQDHAIGILDRPALEIAAGLLRSDATLPPGAELGPYRITEVVGTGGMGQVYRAIDTRLNRTVAIKVLRSELATDAQFRERFEREAKAIAALAHPHICALYDVRTEGHVDFLVLEYLEGETLAARLAKGALPPADALRHAIEIAGALVAAHRSGVVHRDLKPANIVLTKTGAKLLDFGLAKNVTAPIRDVGAAGTSMAPDVTAQGTILGTVQYMSPEQLEGRSADARSDIFAFGAVVYEIFSGKKAFAGTSPASVISAILKDDPPPLATSQPRTPALLDHIIRRCLAKDPDERWQTAVDLARELQWIASAGSAVESSSLSANVARRRRGVFTAPVAWAVAVLMLAASLGVLAYVATTSPERDRAVTRFSAPLPNGVTLAGLTTRTGNAVAVSALAISRDGRRIAFVAQSPDGARRVWMRSLDRLDAQPVPGTEGATGPFWSPDGRRLAFFADGKLKSIEIGSGTPVAICDAPSSNAGSWNEDDVILFSVNRSTTSAVLARVSASGGTPVPVTDTVPGGRHSRPVFLPGGQHFLYYAFTPAPENPHRPKHPVSIGSLDASVHKELVVPDAMNVSYSRGHVLFLRASTLMAQPFDMRTLSLSATAFPVAEQVATQPISPTDALFAASDTGVLVYQSGAPSSTSELVWFDRQGRRTGSIGEPANYAGLSLSPGETRLAVTVLSPSGAEGDIWLYPTTSGLPARFTFDTALETASVWSPDGRTIAFGARRIPEVPIVLKPADGGPEQPLTLAPARDSGRSTIDGPGRAPSDWSPDGRHLLLFAGGDLWQMPLSSRPEMTPWWASQRGFMINGQFDRTGRWVAYQSSESGQLEVYVAAFPGPGVKRQISSGGGVLPRWRGDGKELYFLAPDNTLIAATVVSTESTLDVTGIRPLFKTRRKLLQNGTGYPYAVAADGMRFLINTTPEQEASEPLTVVLNWTAGL
jgi:serine/threonine protein kinase/Tol biopolymer transport system component